MRLIDADDTMNQLRAYADRKHAAGHNELANGILKAVSYIRNNTVRVDAVEVVRCNWIPVSERLPEVLTPVLVMHRYEPYDRVTIGYRFQPDKRCKPYWIFFAYWMGDDMMHHAIGDHMICPGGEYVTHWMPLPEPPKEDHHET